MKLVIDTNILIEALMKNSTSRSIILNENYNFVSPDFTLIEINKYKSLILKKSGLDEKSLNILFSMIFEKIEIIPKLEYFNKIIYAKEMISDKKDVPFLALAMSTNVQGIWSEDKHFREQDKIKIYSTKDLIENIF